MGHNGRCGTHPRRYAAREGEPSQGFRFAFFIEAPYGEFTPWHGIGFFVLICRVVTSLTTLAVIQSWGKSHSLTNQLPVATT